MTQQNVSISDLETRWSLIFRAQDTKGDEAAGARGDLLARYHGAIQAYLRRLMGPGRELDADEICSNFAVRILELDPLLKQVRQLEGKSFRSYLRTVLWRMVKDYHRRRPQEQFRDEHDRDQEPESGSEGDEVFHECWRQELINKTWQALENVDKNVGKLYVLLLQMQQEQAGATYEQLATQLSARIGRPYSTANVRQLVHRGRDLFGDLLVREAALSLGSAQEPVSLEQLEQELIDLKLLFKYTRPALERYGKKSSKA